MAWHNLPRGLNPRELRLVGHVGTGCIKRIDQKKLSVARGYTCSGFGGLEFPGSPPWWGFDVPLATALYKNFLLRMLNDS
jgi:hypothetical protein